MKNALFLTTALAVFALTSNAMADSSATSSANGKIFAKIVAPVEITDATDSGTGLNFGTMLNKSNSVTVATNGNRSETSGVNGLVASSPHAGQHTITGPESTKVTVKLGATTATVSNGSNTMNVTNLGIASEKDANTGGQSVEVETDGSTTGKKLYVGGTLAVTEGQAAGDYIGTYTVTATY